MSEQEQWDGVNRFRNKQQLHDEAIDFLVFFSLRFFFHQAIMTTMVVRRSMGLEKILSYEWESWVERKSKRIVFSCSTIMYYSMYTGATSYVATTWPDNEREKNIVDKK